MVPSAFSIVVVVAVKGRDIAGLAASLASPFR